MGFHQQLFAEQTGLQYDKTSRNFWGTRNGFPVFVRYVAARSSLVFLLYGKQETEQNISTELNDWRMTRSGISALTYRKNCLSCIIAISAKEADLNAINHFDALIKLAQQLSLTPCCMSCGTQYGFRPYILDETGVSLCPLCLAETRQRIGAVQEEKRAEPVSHTGSGIGLLLGAALLFGITLMVLKLGYVSYLTGYAGVLAAFLLIKKLGRKLTPLWAVISVIVCTLIAAAVPVFSFSSDIASFNREQAADAQSYIESYDSVFSKLTEEQISELEEAGTLNRATAKKNYETYQIMLSHQTTMSCVADLTELIGMDTYKSVSGELIKCILWGVLSILIGSAVTLPGMLTEAAGKHDLRELNTE